jgi:hypothetical protein
MDKILLSPANNTEQACYSRKEDSIESSMLFENLEWVKSDVAAFILSMTVGALRTAVCRGEIKATTYRRRLYFKKKDLYKLLETSPTKGGF